MTEIRRLRRDADVPMPDWIPDYVMWLQSRCGSLFEGCMCHLDPDHAEPHTCGAEGCACTWTTKQATAWAEEGYR